MREIEREYFTFVETQVFTRRIDGIASIDVLTAIQDELIENPTRGAIVEGTGGARKARVGDPDSRRGKSGGYRYMYLYLEKRGRIHLLFFFGKSEQANLTPAQKKTVADYVKQIKGAAK